MSAPDGLVYDDDDNVAIDPDEEVAAAISDVFAAFTATGSAYGVAGAFATRPTQGVRIRAAPLPPGRRPGRVSALGGHRTAP